MIKKISSSFDARIFSPNRTFTKFEKERKTKRLKIKFKDHHERDAMLAAMVARKRFLPLFTKIDSHLRDRNLLHLSDEAKELMVKKEAANLEQAILLIKSNIYDRK
jgi:predicted RNase H-like nuclease (RuvC/YqgF family)